MSRDLVERLEYAALHIGGSYDRTTVFEAVAELKRLKERERVFEQAVADLGSAAAELSRLTRENEALREAAKAHRSPFDVLGDQRVGVGVGLNGPFITTPPAAKEG